VFHEVLEHRWYLSEAKGEEVDIFEAAKRYLRSELAKKPEEAISAPPPSPVRATAGPASGGADERTTSG
jgi:hypothetical protein